MGNEQLKIENEKAQKPSSKCCFIWSVIGIIVVLVVGAVVYFVLDDDVCSDVGAGQRVKASSSDYISVVFDSSPNKADCNAFVNAASRLSKAIAETENDLSFAPDADFRVAEVCGLSGENNPVVFRQGKNIQDLAIVAVLNSIDGEGGTLAAAGPCAYNVAAQLPIAGVMIFDTDDTAVLDEFGKLEDVVLHEMMHVLGFGTAWDPIPLADGGFATTFDVLEDEVFTFNDQGVLTATNPNNDPKYTGAAGIAEFEILTGETETFVPIQGVELNGQVIFDALAGEGQGSIDSHIDKDTFQEALMTFAVDVEGGGESPLTAMSLAMLGDVGYTVDTSGADDYELPANTVSVVSNLRGNPSKSLDLSNDVLKIKPVVLDPADPSSLEQMKTRTERSLEEVLGLA
eukprot:maker-scaffold_6-snap-gene-4.16-mRNA-1 protein AED:0.14 eAED:0.14 QI:114/1/1/1/0.5/0.33/3/281/400